MKMPTIYEVLKEKLGREPKHSELIKEINEVRREEIKRMLRGE